MKILYISSTMKKLILLKEKHPSLKKYLKGDKTMGIDFGTKKTSDAVQSQNELVVEDYNIQADRKNED